MSMRNSFNDDTHGETGESGVEIGMLLLCIALWGLVFATVSPLSLLCRHRVDLWNVFIVKVLQGISPVSPLSPREVLF